MPQKRNPDVLELARGRCRELRGIADWHRQIVSGLPGSYHRDFQLHKRPLLAGLECREQVGALRQGHLAVFWERSGRRRRR